MKNLFSPKIGHFCLFFNLSLSFALASLSLSLHCFFLPCFLSFLLPCFAVFFHAWFLFFDFMRNTLKYWVRKVSFINPFCCFVSSLALSCKSISTYYLVCFFQVFVEHKSFHVQKGQVTKHQYRNKNTNHKREERNLMKKHHKRKNKKNNKT